MKTSRAVAVIVCLFVAVQLMALGFMAYLLSPEDQVFEDPKDPAIALYYLLLLLGFTGVFLILLRFNLEKSLKAIFYIAIGFVVFFVAITFSGHFVESAEVILTAGFAFGAVAVIALYLRPEWYVVDAIGITMSVGIIAILGISLSMLPVLILLLALAVYDAIAVYKTKHMLTLAEGVVDMNLPVLLIVPKRLPYSFISNKPKLRGEKKERDAFLVGLGDIIIPGLLPASSFWFIESSETVLGLGSNLWVALAAIVGAVVGLVLVMRAAAKGNPQPGLPFLNFGAIIGFFAAYLLLFGLDLSHLV